MQEESQEEIQGEARDGVHEEVLEEGQGESVADASSNVQIQGG